MKICRFRDSRGEVHWGEILGDSIRRLELADADPVNFRTRKENFPLLEVEFLSPALPTQLIGIGDNFRKSQDDHLTPVVFTKPLSSLVPDDSQVQLPSGYNVWGEPEIGIVIKKTCSDIKNFSVSEYILGFCLVNDTTALSTDHEHDSHSLEAKGQPGFLQVGSFLNTDFNYDAAIVSGSINGNLYRHGKSTETKWDLCRILREVTKNRDLKPFDIIFTGTPSRVSAEKCFLKNGDIFTVEAHGLGKLTTRYRKD